MSCIKCACVSCANNQDNCCCRPNIYVKGELSNNKKETFCENFICKSEGVMTNVIYTHANVNLDILCDAIRCSYNKDKKCVKESVTIDNRSAMNKEQTFCGSFKPAY